MARYRGELETELELLEALGEAYETGATGPRGHAPIHPDIATRLVEFAIACDGETIRNEYRDGDGRVKTFTPKTILNYVANLRLCAQRGLDLIDVDADGLNEFMALQHDERGLSLSTIGIYQSAAVAFYRYHADLGIDPDAIEVIQHTPKPRHDEQDVFTDDEIAALREAADTPRDRAFLELLIYSGQRLTALRTLRIEDIDLDRGVFYLNGDAEGLKGADDRGRKRPLFGARKYVRDWISYHPVGEPEAWLFVGDPRNPETNLDRPWAPNSIRARLKRMAADAGVDKPVNPHAFRHYFVTVMKRDYDLDSDALRALLGVVPHSDVLETTYGHVTTDEYVKKAEIALGYREDEPTESSLTPNACPTCGELLDDHWRRCPACDERFAPGLKQFESEGKAARDRALDEALDPTAEFTDDERAALRALIDALDDPVELLHAAEGHEGSPR